VIEELKVVAQVGRAQELAPHLFTTIPAELRSYVWLLKDVKRPLDKLIGARRQVTSDTIIYLQRDAANITGDDGALLPETLCHRQSKAFA
jgi:hypothetical protein